MNQIDLLFHRLPRLAPCRDDIAAAHDALTRLYRAGNKLLLCGNGGSAADADHWSAELLKSFMRPRPLPPERRRLLGNELADGLQQGLPAIPLTSFPALATAYANDCQARFTFAQLVNALGSPGDILIGISTSGNADNVLLALQTARATGIKTIGLTGQTGGRMKPHCDICIRVPETTTHLIQELHQPVIHALSLAIEEDLF